MIELLAFVFRRVNGDLHMTAILVIVEGDEAFVGTGDENFDWGAICGWVSFAQSRDQADIGIFDDLFSVTVTKAKLCSVLLVWRHGEVRDECLEKDG